MAESEKETATGMKDKKKKKQGQHDESPVNEAAAPETAHASEGGASSAETNAAPTPSAEKPLTVADDRLLRLQADFDNFRKRTVREREETYRRANTDLMTELLPVLDHLELALKAASENATDPAFADGVRLVFDQMLGVLGKFGLSPIDAEGQAFDPGEHEAVSHLPSPDVAENHVMVQSRRGYKLGDRVLRAAQVVVSSGAPD